MALPSYAEAQVLLKDDISCFQALSITKHISLYPKYINKLRTGIREQLNGELGTFSDELDGVIIAYDYGSLMRLSSQGARIHEELPHLHLDIKLDVIIFKPYLNCTLKGVVNKLSDNHVGCLVHNCFNASISKPYHLDQVEWEGSKLTLGEEFLFTVAKIVAHSHVLFMRGSIPDGSLSVPEPVTSPKKKKHKKRKRASDSEKEEDSNSGVEEPPHKKHKRRSYSTPGFSSPVHMHETSFEPSHSRLSLSQDDIDQQAADLIALVQKPNQVRYSEPDIPDHWPSQTEKESDSGVDSFLSVVDQDHRHGKSKSKKYKHSRDVEAPVAEQADDFTVVSHKKKKKKKDKKKDEQEYG